MGAKDDNFLTNRIFPILALPGNAIFEPAPLLNKSGAGCIVVLWTLLCSKQ